MTQPTVAVTPHLSRYDSEGYVVFNEMGEVGKVCAENLNVTAPSANRSAEILHAVASSLCRSLTYKYAIVISYYRRYVAVYVLPGR